MDQFWIEILLVPHYPLTTWALENRNVFKRNSADFTLIFVCRTCRKKNPSMSSAFDSCPTASIKSLFAFCSKEFCSLVRWLRKSLEFPISSFKEPRTCPLGQVTEVPWKISNRSTESHRSGRWTDPNSTKWGECLQYTWNNCIRHRVLLNWEHFQAVQFLSQVRWCAATGTQRLQGLHFNACIVFFCICRKSESCFCWHRCFVVLSTKDVTTFSTVGKWKKQVLQNSFFLSLDWAWLLASSLREESISVPYCKSWEIALFTYGIKEV